ncbi:26S proteasome regulatory subunit [Venturia nashicola]|uniref:26S proteasome regulatory subunit n=1 Tax=Venturia nashicola TaxID=86259 RepID=A0A4Z1PHI3_9PEZI|nr:26S proteasome regulatory subunit [Venturia nashicola]TLD37274.1 26S proteasome regulatory subunit [Venturia nashicola]
MKLTPALVVAAALVSSVSATSYDNCCCTKKQPSGNWGCDDDAGAAVINDYNGRYAWSAYTWKTSVLYKNGPKYPGKYFYATGNGKGKNGDHKIGAQEIGAGCERHQAGQSCFNIPGGQCIDYTGKKVC